MEGKCVRYANFPDTTNGHIGFYQFKEVGEAKHPRIMVIKEKARGRSYVQISPPVKMDEIAIQIRAKTRRQFREEMGGLPSLSAYSEYLSREIGRFLETAEERGKGLVVHVNDGKKLTNG